MKLRRPPPGAVATPRGSRSFWLKHLHRWHWISAAICLVGMLLFAATGITLNHAADIPATPQVTTSTATLPPALLAQLGGPPEAGKQPLPPPVRAWLGQAFGISAGSRDAEWSPGEIYLALPRPGGDAWVSIERGSGEASYEVTSRGWIAYLNDLHKGRDTGPAWRWFIDVFAVACLVFCGTGLTLLHLHAGGRPATWPLVGLGLVAPLILLILFIH
ncbi:PepSY-associated TM helix domain-containing protein [Siccirubricoccus phaeus]|uniref:PepSY-associated TM helix domain-containing protein n=1 Tax=Siccirubricoccus phaeus TaxID=2595053 RepID=UPI0011F18364|nr:PepSY-associated TM helix domain-containing protein [Siccirubricoccus phaeus]